MTWEAAMENLISKSQFTSRLSYYFRKIEKTVGELVIRDHGRPVLKIVPYAEDPDIILMSLQNTVIQYIEPTEPVGFED